jgi:hypothetical protein
MNPVYMSKLFLVHHKRKRSEANCPKILQSPNEAWFPNEDDTLCFNNMNIKWENGKDFASIWSEKFYLIVVRCVKSLLNLFINWGEDLVGWCGGQAFKKPRFNRIHSFTTYKIQGIWMNPCGPFHQNNNVSSSFSSSYLHPSHINGLASQNFEVVVDLWELCSIMGFKRGWRWVGEG